MAHSETTAGAPDPGTPIAAQPGPGRKVLITGGAGFIGATIATACLEAGFVPIVVDDLSTGLRPFAERFDFYEGDFGDRSLIRRVLADHDLYAVVHCAASIVVPDSITDPLRYYGNNVAKLPGFLQELLAGGCHRVLFSSTAAMYEPGPDLVVDEESPVRPLSPYAASKAMAERMLADTAAASPLQVISLRYFNPIGADPSGRTGQQVPCPSHVLGKMFQALESGEPLTVTGTDWPTRDGSGLRDYVHVWDLALAHLAALDRFDEIIDGRTTSPRYDVINVGTGRGTTVFELIEAFNSVLGCKLPIRTSAPRKGDVVGCTTSVEKAERVLHWHAERTTAESIADGLAWSAKLPAVIAADAASTLVHPGSNSAR